MAGAAEAAIHQMVSRDISSHHVFVYMKGSPTEPRCGNSFMVCRILEAYGARFGSRDVYTDRDLRKYIKTFTYVPTSCDDDNV